MPRPPVPITISKQSLQDPEALADKLGDYTPEQLNPLFIVLDPILRARHGKGIQCVPESEIWLDAVETVEPTLRAHDKALERRRKGKTS